MRKSFKYRIYANRETLSGAEEVLNLCRILYNLALDQRINAWKCHGKYVSGYDQANQLSDLKKGFPEFKKVPSQTLQDVIERLDKSYQSFFRRVKRGKRAGFPRFKGMGRYDSFTLKKTGWKLDGKYLTINKIGKFKIKFSRPIEGAIKTVTIRRTLSDKWFVSFVCDDVPYKPLPKTGKTVGIDVGCESFLTDSDNRKIENPRFLNKSQDILTKRQQSMGHKERGSNRRKKAKLLVAKIYEKITNQRRDFHFKVANKLVKENDIICIEKLHSWKTFRKLNRSMGDVAWFNFFNILRFKAEEAGKEVIEVPAKNTSHGCSGCGAIVKKGLSIRVHRCSCGLEIDRDYNAALNILRLGQSLQASVSST